MVVVNDNIIVRIYVSEGKRLTDQEVAREAAYQGQGTVVWDGILSTA